MALSRRGKSWVIDYTWNRKRIRESVGPSKEEARILLAERLIDVRQGRDPSLRRVKPRLFEEAAKQFLVEHVTRSRSRHAYEVKVKALAKRFEGRMLTSIGPKEIQQFVAGRIAGGASPATTNRDRAILSAVFHWAIDAGFYGGTNPCKTVKAFAESPGRTRALTGGEAEALVAAASDHLKPVLVCALHTGGRLGEILSLRWEDIDLERGVLYFTATNTKSGKGREIPIDATLDAVLRERRKRIFLGGDARDYCFTRLGKRLRNLRTGFEKAVERSKLGGDVTFHTLRHTFASWYVQNGGDLYRLQKYLGHSTIALTQRYAHLSDDFRKAGVAFFGPPKEVPVHRSVTGGSDAQDAEGGS